MVLGARLGRSAAALVLAAGPLGCESPPRAEPEPPVRAEPAADASADASAVAAPTPAPAAAASHDPAAPTPVAAEVHALGALGLQLQVSANACSVHVTGSGPTPTVVPLALEPPCHWLLWGYPPPTNPAESGGRARGVEGGPMAWEYAEKGGTTTVVVVIGGPLTEADPARRTKLLDARCGERTQAVRLTASGATASTRIAEGSVSCERSGADEKEFWLFGHDPAR